MAVAVSGTRRTIKELVDGTLRVQIDIDREHRRDFLRLFPDIDMPIALAPLKVKTPGVEGAAKGGELSKLAGILCNDPDFLPWLERRMPPEKLPAALGGEEGAERAAVIVRHLCGVKSRAELDHNSKAAVIFHEQIRRPWSER
jgi:hypothetical protein